MSSTEITNEQMTAGATVLAGYKNLRLNWRNAAIDVFEAMMATAPASADNPSTAGAAKPAAALTDKGRAVKWNDDYAKEPWVSSGYRPLYLAAPAPHAQPEPAAQALILSRATLTNETALPELARQFADAYESGRALTLAAASCKVLFDAMTSGGADQVPTAAEVRDQALNGIPATHLHDEGAIARCSYCRRYSLDRATLSDRQPMCECGKQHGWSGSFVPPTEGSRWSGKAPAQASAHSESGGD